ncbi:MAG: DUF1501 domain-containing protein [Planctomycetota bacterium]
MASADFLRGLGFTRRQSLQLGMIGALGLSFADLQKLRAAPLAGPKDVDSPSDLRVNRARPNACVFVFLFGGPSHMDLWDLKPDAPEEIRGEFKRIDTRVPGLSLCEHLPNLAQQADKICLVRSMTHHDRVHGTACSEMFTGRPHRRPGSTDQASPDDWPSVSASTMRFRDADGGMPSSIVLPWYLQFAGQGERIAGQTGGIMGERYNAFLVQGDPSQAKFRVPAIQLPAEISSDRILSRQDLLNHVERRSGQVLAGEQGHAFASHQKTAFAMVGGSQAARAFDLSLESESVRQSYGSNKMGQSFLLARRLLEAGVSLVSVNWDDDSRDEKVSPFWDTHDHNFAKLKDRLLPAFDRCFPAFLQDLSDRGLLDSTLVVVMGEFGRSPFIGKISQNNMTEKTGRDHWPHAFTVLLAGGGVRGGQIHGASDGIGAYVKDKPVTPADLAATIFRHLGIDTKRKYRDPLGVEYEICTGEPITDLG